MEKKGFFRRVLWKNANNFVFKQTRFERFNWICKLTYLRTKRHCYKLTVRLRYFNTVVVIKGIIYVSMATNKMAAEKIAMFTTTKSDLMEIRLGVEFPSCAIPPIIDPRVVNINALVHHDDAAAGLKDELNGKTITDACFTDRSRCLGQALRNAPGYWRNADF
ncbi:hypothetical protein TcasGA2_TC006289 [Tribolium castaneum]|uniref:Uncharacterized protein n=1 Tax=Tribolium castaneum TaxID=7070 RepID=D6WVX2_TRICA|nr:hypothetical protein TcasGA2_TC006289 [Tribolium castaneum]